ncbi:nucleotidyltransferase family protein [Tanticharoenia sakaeratensis]|jgi:GTP:adenosylcobinamide-phosphate guanylyltransferase|uniref:MobA-like NTP transferase domain-containing protein n=1 Tax=Tanticharoenia sakaeratensis NBRC 103193 TaxID=1231623 RepID=A0A0D6MK06_9PROT|nr:nucleotidyltransferase family protein [Tanticharoenia sakaeratensis]GAN53770.1 hypothetical protein Tasa_010_317 [Tanticharoenia sakaeratensis NBRC 103193]GBQ16963.1 hypothetical protein AA103193_0169 [Tanticharoenia sakaeratensis NBRC 103193]
MALAALILAGTRAGADDPMARAYGVRHKALLPVNGRPMLARVVDALRATTGIGRIAVSIETPAPVEALFGEDIAVLPAAAGPSQSIAEGLDALGAPMLITTADHPLLRPEWITAFVARAAMLTPSCDFAIGIATRTVIERDVPGTRRTYITLRDMVFSGCNLFLARTPRAAAVLALWQRIEHARKQPLKMAALLGPGLLARALTRTLTSDALCARITRLTGARPALIPIDNGWAAVDVDKPADLALVTRHLADAAAMSRSADSLSSTS